MSSFGRWCRGDDRGVAATEFVVIFPLFMIIVFGLISAGSGYWRQLQLTQGAREAARYGATLAPDDDDGLVFTNWLDAVADRADQAALGQWDYICVAYVGPPAKEGEDSPLHAERLERGSGTAPATAPNQCFDDARPSDERRTQVLIQRDSPFGAYFFSTTIRLGSTGIARYEAIRPKDD